MRPFLLTSLWWQGLAAGRERDISSRSPPAAPDAGNGGKDLPRGRGQKKKFPAGEFLALLWNTPNILGPVGCLSLIIFYSLFRE